MCAHFFFLSLFWGRSGGGEEGAGECLLDLISRCAAVSRFFWPLSDAGRSSLALHTNQGVNSVPEAIRANCGAS